MNVDHRISSYNKLPNPKDLIIPLKGDITKKTRMSVHNILAGKDKRFVIFIGPCSIHSEQSAINYAKKLKDIQKNLPNLLLIMRFFIQKPRTTIGWTGFLEYPNITGPSNIFDGLVKTIKLVHTIVDQVEQPICMELLGTTIEPQYFNNYLSTGFIGARTSESQIHRNLASGVSFPMGIKNPSDGNAKVAYEGVLATRAPHSFCGINIHGDICAVNTKGNNDSFVVLRGSYKNGPNIIQGVKDLYNKDVSIVVDCCHGNSNKNLEKTITNALESSRIDRICGLMIESHIKEGKQSIKESSDIDISITDPCLGWENTVKLLEQINEIRSSLYE